jgi:hypothetical protein
LLKLDDLSDVFSIADVNIVGSFQNQTGKNTLYLYYDGNVVFVSHNEFELSKRSINVAGFQGDTVSENFNIRNNSSSPIDVWIEPIFSPSLVSLTIPGGTYYNIAPSAIEQVNLSFVFDESALGNYVGAIKVIAKINDTNQVRSLRVSAEVRK